MPSFAEQIAAILAKQKAAAERETSEVEGNFVIKDHEITAVVDASVEAPHEGTYEVDTADSRAAAARVAGRINRITDEHHHVMFAASQGPTVKIFVRDDQHETVEKVLHEKKATLLTGAYDGDWDFETSKGFLAILDRESCGPELPEGGGAGVGR